MGEEEEAPLEKGRAVKPPEEEKPVFDLGELIKARKARGEPLSLSEAYLVRSMMREDRLERQDLQRPKETSSPETESLKRDLSDLKESVKTLMDTIQTMRETEAQKAFAEGIVKSINDQIMPTIKTLDSRIASIEETQKTTAKPAQEPSELSEAIKGFTKVVDALGEKAGARALTLGDVDILLGVIDKVKETVPKPESAGEWDWRTAGITTFGEIGKELIGAYRDIETKRAPEEVTEKATPETKKIIERQVYNHVMKMIAGGAKELNVYETADALGLTPRQVYDAVETLKSKGYLRITAPSKAGVTKAGGEEEKAFEEEGEVIKPSS